MYIYICIYMYIYIYILYICTYICVCIYSMLTLLKFSKLFHIFPDHCRWFYCSLVVVSCSVMVGSCSVLIGLCFGNRHFKLILVITFFSSILIILLIIPHYTDLLIWLLNVSCRLSMTGKTKRITGCISHGVINGNQNLIEIITSKKFWLQIFKIVEALKEHTKCSLWRHYSFLMNLWRLTWIMHSSKSIIVSNKW